MEYKKKKNRNKIPVEKKNGYFLPILDVFTRTWRVSSSLRKNKIKKKIIYNIIFVVGGTRLDDQTRIIFVPETNIIYSYIIIILLRRKKKKKLLYGNDEKFVFR